MIEEFNNMIALCENFNDYDIKCHIVIIEFVLKWKDTSFDELEQPQKIQLADLILRHKNGLFDVYQTRPHFREVRKTAHGQVNFYELGFNILTSMIVIENYVLK
jgi:hypothetical protein